MGKQIVPSQGVLNKIRLLKNAAIQNVQNRFYMLNILDVGLDVGLNGSQLCSPELVLPTWTR